jgi:hypothetical protein
MARLVILLLVMEEVCGPLEEKPLTLFNDNSPTIGWATKLASKHSTVAEHLLQALALRAKMTRACPFTPIHIEEKQNAILDIPSQSFGSNPAWKCDTHDNLLTLFNSTFPLQSQQSWTVFYLNCKAGTHVTFRLADDAFCTGQLTATSLSMEGSWRNWCSYVTHLGVDPYLQHTKFETKIRCLTGFGAHTITGYYRQGQQVQAATVTGATTAVGQKISMAVGDNPTKVSGSEKFLPALQVMIEGYSKADSPTKKMLPVEADVPELLVKMGYGSLRLSQTQATGNLLLIAFYCLLKIGEYTVKGMLNNSKHTEQFKLEDVTFFKENKLGQSCCLPKKALDHLILMADSATLNLDNQKNGWKGACIHQETNGELSHCPI